MIAHRLGLAIALLVAVVLGVIVIVDRGERAPSSRALVTGLDTDKIVRLAWSRGGQPELVIERAGTAWRWTRPIADVPADPAAIDAVLAALRGGRWHRRAEIARAGSLRIALVATAGERSLKIGMGEGVPGAGQSWIAMDDHAYLVDDWIARALAPAPLALRETRPLAEIASAQTIVIERLVPFAFAVRIEGTPRKLVRPIELYLEPKLVDGLQRALAALTIVDVPTQPGFVTTTFTIDAPRLITLEQRDNAGCPGDMLAISGTFGPGCVLHAQWDAVEQAITLLREPSTQLADGRALPFDPIQLTLPDGTILDLSKRPRIGDRDADPARVAELLATLGARYAIADTTPSKPVATLVATSRANATVTLELLATKRIRRKGEPVELAVGAGAWDVLMRTAAQLRDPTPWSEEPTTIRTITIDNTTFTRGAVIGEWTGATDGARIEELARMLAKPRVTDTPRAPAKVLHTVAFEVVAPGAAPLTHTLQLGEGCLARIADDAVALDAALCRAIASAVR
jgi:hypothetical protein